MKKHHINRLEKLYTFLGTVNPKKFDFSSWAESTSGKPDVNVCGTTACALGWAGSMPEFRKRGLKLEWDVSNYGPDDVVADASVILRDRHGMSIAEGEEAGAEFFGLTDEEADYLFIPDGQSLGEGIGPSDMSLKDYRRELRKFINSKKRELKIT